jgi:hypothetical protein
MKICTKCTQPTENIYPKSSWCRPCLAAGERARLADPAYRAKKKARHKELMQDPEYRLNFNRKQNIRARRNYKFYEKMKRCHSKHRYGMTLDERKWLYNLYPVCWLCESVFLEHHAHGDRRVDHDHSHHPGSKRMCKGCIRGVLCDICNRLVLPYTERKPLLQNERVKAYLRSRPFLESVDEGVIRFLRDFGIRQMDINNGASDTGVARVNLGPRNIDTLSDECSN